jgi:AsmA protein
MPALPPFSAGGLAINDARITFQDKMTGASYRLDDFDLHTGAVSLGEPIDMEIAFDATDVANDMSVQGTASLTVNFDIDAMNVALANVKVDLAVKGADLPGDSLTLSAQTEAVDFDIDAMNVALANVKADLAVKGADLPGDGLTLSAQTEAVEFDIDSGNLIIRNQRASVTAVGSTVNIVASGTIIDGAPKFSGTVSLEPLSPRELLRALDQPDIETSDPKVLSRLEATANWAMGKELLAVDELTVRLDDTTIEGDLQINYLDQSGLNFDFVADQLAIDRYLAPEQEPTAQKTGGSTGPTKVPVETVRELDFSGRIRLGRLTMNALLLENLNARIRASEGRIRLNPMTADLYGGRYSGRVTINVTGKKPTVNFKQSVTKVQAAGLLTDLADTSNLEGVLEASFTGKGVGRTDRQIIKSLNGNVAFDLVDGVYKGVDVWYEIRRARALLKGEPGPKKSAEPETPIEALTFTGRIKDGVLNTKKLVAQIPFLRLNGNGTLNIAQENLNFRFQARVHEKPVFPDGEDLAGLQGLMIPLTVTGAVASPSVGVDLGELMKSEVVKKATEKAEDLLLDKLGLTKPEEDGTDKSKKEDARDLVKKGLRDLFGR